MKKKNILIKEFFRKVKGSRNRFLSILTIVFLGVAFFSGIRASGPDMQLSADKYFDEARLMDIRIIGTLGLTDEDVEELQTIKGVKAVDPSYSGDVLCDLSTSQPVLHLMAYTPDMNDLTIKEGRLPQEENEIFLDQQFMEKYGLKTGDVIRINTDSEKSTDEFLNVKEFTITGAGNSPFYMSLDRGTSRLGDGTVAGYGVVPMESFSMDVYTEIYLTLEDSKDAICYQDEYKEIIDDVKERLEILSRGRCKIRYAGIQADGKEEINFARQDIVDARKQLNDAKETLEEGKRQLEAGKEELRVKEQELSQGKNQLIQESGKLQEGKSQLAEGKRQLEQQTSFLEKKQQELNQAKGEIAKNEKELSSGLQQISQGEKALEEGEKKLSENEQQIAAGEQQLAEGKQKIQNLQGVINDLKPLVDTGKEQIPQYQETIKKQQEYIVQYEQELQNSRTELENMKLQLEDFMKDPENNAQKIEILQAKITQKEKEITVTEGLLTEAKRIIHQADAALKVAENLIAQYDQAVLQMDAAQEELVKKEQELKQGKEAIIAGKAKIQEQKGVLEQSKKELQQGQQQLEDGKRQVEDGEKQLSMGQQQIHAAHSEIHTKSAQIAQGETELKKAEDTMKEGEDALKDAQMTLAEKEQELQQGWDTYYKEEKDAQTQIQDGEQQIKDAEKQLEKLEMPVWYVLGRDSIQTYVEYEQDTQRIVAIARVFPVIFFLVAALICLNTMTRMVEENRTQIGTLKALGYGKMAIAGKYLAYAFLASMIGSIAGFVLGQLILPRVVIGAYSILYTNLPIIQTPIYIGYSIGSTLLAVGITVLAAGASCFKELQEVPSRLMRPEPPQNGKRILLERIPIIWKHLSFSNKATARNLFRYKKRFFMTILGIGGCMGLLMTGFGLKDSIMVIGEKQFGDIRTYSSTIILEDEITQNEKETLFQKIEKDNDVIDSMEAYETSVDVASEKAEKTSYMVVVPDTEKFRDFVKLKNRLSKKEYQLDDEGIIITEKLAKLLGVKAGDTVFLKDGETKKIEVKVTHVVENYFFHYVYMTPKVYQKLYGKEPVYTKIFTMNKDTSTSFEKQFQERYMEEKGVLNVSFLSSIHDRIKNMLKSMDTVIYVIVLAAGMLAFVVLYNLNNINISERRRELATLKVLGFYDMEVSKYVFRENVILTVFGSMLGIIFGLILHRFMILTAEIDIMMFGRNMKPISLLYSICLTFLFSFLVNLFMHFKLKKLDMVESMKSVE